jgi:hypothetical protein
MKVLFLFMDGIGLGEDDPARNPFAKAAMPHLQALLDGRRLVAAAAPYSNARLDLLSLDACLGAPGMPQSATGQAVLLTGQDIPALLGYHYGPKPNPEIAALLKRGNLFQAVLQSGRRAAFLNAYPPRYFDGLASGRRLYSAIPLAADSAGLRLLTIDDLRAGRAISADLTGQGWLDHLGLTDIPILSAQQAGRRLAQLAQEVDLAFFEYWLSDYAGHAQDMESACSILQTFDQALGGLLSAWDDSEGLIVITSDHGNLEDLHTRRHTANPVPALLIGAPPLRQAFSEGLSDLTGVTPAILRSLGIASSIHFD